MGAGVFSRVISFSEKSTDQTGLHLRKLCTGIQIGFWPQMQYRHTAFPQGGGSLVKKRLQSTGTRPLLISTLGCLHCPFDRLLRMLPPTSENSSRCGGFPLSCRNNVLRFK